MEKLVAYLNQISPIGKEASRLVYETFEPGFLEANECFVREGQYAQNVGFLESGIVRAYFVNDRGKEYNKQFFVGPSLIGAYTSLLTGKQNRIAQQALTDCRVWKAPFRRIEALFERYHELERLGRKIAEYYFLEKEKKELEMALLDAEKRYLILREEFPGIENEIPQYHIASYLGISPTQLSRVRNKLASAG